MIRNPRADEDPGQPGYGTWFLVALVFVFSAAAAWRSLGGWAALQGGWFANLVERVF